VVEGQRINWDGSDRYHIGVLLLGCGGRFGNGSTQSLSVVSDSNMSVLLGVELASLFARHD
jgi:hypothetical protein